MQGDPLEYFRKSLPFRRRAVQLAMYRILVVGTVALGLAVQCLAAQDDLEAAKRKMAELEVKLSKLQAEAAAVDKELTDARSHLTAFVEATRRETKTYESAVEMLRNLPRELQPNPVTGWTAADAEKAKEWLAANVTRQRFQAYIPVHAVSVAENRGGIVMGNPPGTEPGPGKWRVKLSLWLRTLPYLKTQVAEHLWTPFGSRTFYMFGDDDLAAGAKRIGTMQTVRISGTIERVDLHWDGKQPNLVNIWLKGWTLKAATISEYNSSSPKDQ